MKSFVISFIVLRQNSESNLNFTFNDVTGLLAKVLI